MSAETMKKQSRTDWNRVDAMSDKDVDTEEIPALDNSFFESAEIRMPTPKMPITIRLDADVLNWYKSQGKGYQTRINAVLKAYKEAQERAS